MSGRLSVRPRLAAAFVLAATLFGLGLALFLLSPRAAPAAAAEATVIGMPPTGQTAFEQVGRVDQDGGSFDSYGYLTYINGLDDALLFTTNNPLSRTEATARFTYRATATLTARSVISNIFVVNTTGVITFYLNSTPAGDFSNPASFSSGTPIATASIRFQDVLNVQAPNMGIATGTGELTQTASTPFDLDGQTYQFGTAGLLERVATTGEGMRTEPVIPRSITVLAGHAVVIGQRTTSPVVLNGTSE